MVGSIAWIIATVVGLAVGGFVFHFPGSFGEPILQPAAMVFGTLIGGVSGLFVGLLQSLALRLDRDTGGRLALAMGIGIGGTHGLADGAPMAIGFVTVAAIGSVVLAGAFVVLLEVRSARLLLAISGAWFVGLVVADQVTGWVGLPFSETPVGWSTDHAVNGVIVGLVWGAATAIARLPAWIAGRRRIVETVADTVAAEHAPP